MRRVYLDHAATTPVDPEVAELMAQVLREVPGNPSSIYAEGRRARALVDRARDEVAHAIDDRTAIVSVMHGNNEIGTLQPIALIGALCRDRRVAFHSDAVQTVGALEIDVRALPVDL